MTVIGLAPPPAKQAAFALSLLFAGLSWTGCATTPPNLPPIDVTEPGWTVRQGQAIWKTAAAAPEIVGELIVAVHQDGRSLCQFTKNPLPLIVAQFHGDQWQLRYVPQSRVISGSGTPPPHAVWLHLASTSAGSMPDPPLAYKQTSSDQWILSNQITGETISVFLNP